MARVRVRTRAVDELAEPLLQTNDSMAGSDTERHAARTAASRTPPCTAGHGRWSVCWFNWVTPLMQTGNRRQLQAEDLLRLDPGLQPELCGRRLWLSWNKELLIWPERPSLLRALARTYGRPYAWLGLVKLLTDLMSFSGPLLLKLLVNWLATAARLPSPPAAEPTYGSHPSDSEARLRGAAAGAQGWLAAAPEVPANGSAAASGGGGIGNSDPWVYLRAWAAVLGPSSPYFGIVCVALLGLTSVARALLNAHFNFQLSRLSCQLRAGLMCVLYRKSLLAVQYGHRTVGAVTTTIAGGGGGGGGDADADAAATAHGKVEEEDCGKPSGGGADADASTLMSVDSGRAVNLLLSFHELWSLPMQMVLALYLLYTQVRYAFLAGLAVSLLLVPANRLIAGRILVASRDMMAAKDARVGAMSELLRGIAAVKTAPHWEKFYVAKLSAARRRELRGLAARKYLDALCVYFWAATSLLFSAMTFGLVVVLGGAAALTPGVAFTALSLFQLLTGPLNAFPWVVNGVVEAVVSVRRLQAYLSRPEAKAFWAYEDLELHLRDLPPKAAAAVLHAAAVNTTTIVATGGGGSGGLLAALREVGPAAAAASVGGGDAAAADTGARPLDRLLRSSRLPPAAAAALRWRSRVLEHKRMKSGAGTGGTAVVADSTGGMHEVARSATAAAGAVIVVRVTDASSGGVAEPIPPPSSLPPLPPQPPSRSTMATLPADQVAARLENATFAWGLAARPCLHNISLAIPRGALTVIVGRVGAGKSSLLAALLGPSSRGGSGGELPLLHGTCCTYVGRLSYAQQHPWIIAGTLRENVLLGAAMDERLYWQVLHDCALLPDLAALPGGDLSHVGDNGCKLSGGQRARLGLARALYHAAKPAAATPMAAAVVTRQAQIRPRRGTSDPEPDISSSQRRQDADLDPGPWSPHVHTGLNRPCTAPVPDPDVMVLLDDVLASLDRSCAAHVVQHALLGCLLRPRGPPPPPSPPLAVGPTAGAAGSTQSNGGGGGGGSSAAAAATAAAPTVVLVSNDVRCLRAASLVVALEGGRVLYMGSPEGFLASEQCPHRHHQPHNPQHDRQYQHHHHHHHQEQRHPYQQPQQQPQPQHDNDDGQEDRGDSSDGPGHASGVDNGAIDGRGCRVSGGTALGSCGGGGGDGYIFGGSGGGEEELENDSSQGGGDTSMAGSSSGHGGAGGDGGGFGSAGGIDVEADACIAAVGSNIAVTTRRRRGRRRSGDDTAVRLREAAAATVVEAAAAARAVEEAAEEREVGHVRWRVYGRYGRAVGSGVVMAVLLSLALMQASRNASDLWVSYFAAHSGGGGGAAAAAGVRSAKSPLTAAATVAAAAAMRRNKEHGAAAAAAAVAEPNGSFPRPLLRRRLCVTAGESADEAVLRAVSASSRPAAESSTRDNRPAAAAKGTTFHGGTTAAGTASRSRPFALKLPAVWHWCSAASAMRPHPVAGLAAAASTAAVPEGMDGRGASGGGYAAVCPLLAAAAPAPATMVPSQGQALAAAGSEDDGAGGGGGGSGGRFWTAHTFLWGVLVIAAANSVFTMARAFSFAFAGMRAAALLHEQLLRAVLSAPLEFFESASHGRILNRFSSDTSAVDDSLPFILNIALANAASLVGLLAVLCYSAPPLLLLLVPLAITYRRLQLFYRSSSREVRRLEALALSPVYAAFGGVAEAAPLVRAFGVQPYFLGTAVAAVTRHQRAAITGGAASAWLGLRLQLLASGLVVAVAGLAVWRSSNGAGAGTIHRHDGLSDGVSDGLGVGSRASDFGGSSSSGGGGDLVASLAGLSLAYVLPVVGLLNGLLTTTAETEQEMVAVERITQYVDQLQPQPDTLPPLPPQLPSAKGSAAASGGGGDSLAVAVAVRVESLVVRYRPGLPPALNGLSLVVGRGQHVGLCGRTGAGKSTVVAALLRLVEAEAGRVFLYGVDVRSVPLSRLRSSVGVLLQRPLLASGTVRENLDPLAAAAAAATTTTSAAYQEADIVAAHSDAALCDALRRVGLWDALAAAATHRRGGGAANGTVVAATAVEVLGLPLGALRGAIGLSAGQQQLLCLARLLLRPRRLVLLDECSAHVDPVTAATIRRLVSEQILQRPPGPATPTPPTLPSGVPHGAGANAAGSAGGACGPPPQLPRVISTTRNASPSAASWHLRCPPPFAAVATVDDNLAGRTAVLEVAHDLAAIEGCERVVVLEGGRAVEEGSPGHLVMQEGSRFRALCLAAAAAAAVPAAAGAGPATTREGTVAYAAG